MAPRKLIYGKLICVYKCKQMRYNDIVEVRPMAVISVRIPDNEYKYAEQFAKFDGLSMSEYVRRLIEERIEDYEDLKAIEEYERDLKNNPNQKLYTHEEVWEEILNEKI